MDNTGVLPPKSPLRHFVKRAQRYNHSSGWVDDQVLIKKIRDLAQAGTKARLLDVAIGTGKVAQAFFGRAGYVVGIDICPQMAKQAKKCADKILLALAEKLPFADNVFDVCVCRQGLQFMETRAVLSEIHRVLKPGGKLILCHLTAYDERDKDQTFLIQKLRNPARKNFFLPQDFRLMLRKQSFKHIESFEYITRESIKRWINNAAISSKAKEEIKNFYLRAPQAFKERHNIYFKDGDIFDSMKMVIVRARKEGAVNA